MIVRVHYSDTGDELGPYVVQCETCGTVSRSHDPLTADADAEAHRRAHRDGTIPKKPPA